MRKPKIKIIITKEDSGYSANAMIRKNFIGTEAESFEELQLNILEAIDLTFEELGYKFTIDEIQFEYDLKSFFDFYKVINAKALSERIGMNQSLLSQYISGIKKPSAAQTKRILKGVHQIGKELSEVRFLL